MIGNTTRRQLSLETRRELIQAIAERYRTANRADKRKILDEFTEVTGFHRKHAIRALRQRGKEASKPARSRLYDEAIVQALTILWEAADRICGKRLQPAIPVFVEAMERHGHLSLANPDFSQASLCPPRRDLSESRRGGLWPKKLVLALSGH